MSSVGSETVDTSDGGAVLALRERLIAELRELGAVRGDAVANAIRSVPRHVFLPEEAPVDAYAAERAYVTKRDADGVALSSVSAARIQAFMLEQADVRPGMRVLEIGSGGYNAALLAELVGPGGEVTTIDIDPDVVARAARLLASAGYERVLALVADGACGEPGHAPYDRIVVTVEAADVSPSWVEQLTGSGVIVVPLRLRGVTRSVALVRRGDCLVAEDYEVCGFVPMRGRDALAERLVIVQDSEGVQVGFRLDTGGGDDIGASAGAVVDPRPLREALGGSAVWEWSVLQMTRGESFADLDLYLSTVVPGYALMAATREARDCGVVASWSPMGISSVLHPDGHSFAYVAMRPVDEQPDRYAFGAVGHGPDGASLARDLAGQVTTWARHYRDRRARYAAFPQGTSDDELPPGRVVERPAHRFTISWPSARDGTSTGCATTQEGER